jgi:hypothetical protein
MDPKTTMVAAMEGSPRPGESPSAGDPGGGWRPGLKPEDAEALLPALEQALQLSVRRDRRVLAAALAPVVGGALRRSFWNVFKRAIARMNRFLVLTFSADGLRWHFEALRTGKPFGTVVREHSLIEPVTQVFLIHRRTGLLLAQVMRPTAEGQDGDMVSGMLTAIQDFVHDSFTVDKDGKLEVIRVGEVSVLIEQGPHAILAGIISQGYEPPPLREMFRRTLRRIHEDYAAELERFRGDISGFASAAVILQGCLGLSMIKGDDRISPLTGVLLAAPVVALLVFGGLFVERALRWHRYLEVLAKEPGIVVLETGWRGGLRSVKGLSDPLAVDPGGLLSAFGFVADDVHAEWARYQAMDEALVLPRVRRALDLPSTVNVAIRDGIVVLDGSAPAGWKEDAACRLNAILGFKGLQMDALREEGLQEQQAWDRYRERLGKTPGIVVLTQGRHGGRFFITGLRDPLAPDPDALLAADGPPPAMVDRQWVPFQALAPEMVQARALRLLAPPPTVKMTLENGVLHLSGRAANAWIRNAQLAVGGLAGIEQLEMGSLEDTDFAALNALIPTLEEPVFFYLADLQSLWPGQERRLADFIEAVRRFMRLSRRIGARYVIEIRGHTPASGDADTARSASQAIAERFYERLQQSGLDAEVFTRCGKGGAVAPSVAAGDGRRRETHISFGVLAAE